MRINFDEINQDDFQVSTRDLPGVGPVVLIGPGFTKHKWSEEDRHLRSLLCRPDGEIISSGFPKFHNYGEVPELDLITQEAILSGRAWFTEKMDGSLLIRSVINGKVHFRTRGSHSMEEKFSAPIMKLIGEKYPRLMDPEFDQRYSLLFEYTSPENLIVVQYEDITLTVLGLMDLTASPPEFVSNAQVLRTLQGLYGTPAVPFHQLSGDLSEVIDQVRSWKGREGVVAWCQLPNGKLHLSKIKADEYRRIHSLKFQLTNEKVQHLCWYKDITSLDQLKAEFFRLGVDWEAVSFVEPIFSEFCARKFEATKLITDLVAEIVAAGVESYTTQKEKALKIEELAGGNRRLFSAGIHYVMKNHDIQEFIDAMTLQISVNQLKNARKVAAELAEYVEAKNLLDHEVPDRD